MPDFKAMLEGYGFTRVTPRGHEINADCVMCGDRSRKFYLNEHKSVAICFKGCFAGPIVDLVARLEGCEREDAEHLVHQGGDWVVRVRRAFESKALTDPRRIPFVMPQTRPLNNVEVDYLRSRRVDVRLALSHGACGCDDYIGMIAAFKDCKREEAEQLLNLWPRRMEYLKNRILFPVKRIDDLLGAEARSVAGSSLKTVYPENVNLKRTFFKSLNLDGAKFVVLVEGILDLLSIEHWGFPAVASFSAGISHEQCASLMTFERVYCAYDPDKGGMKGLALVNKRLAGGTELMHIRLPPGNDPNECTEFQFSQAFVDARPVPQGAKQFGNFGRR